MQNEEWTGSSVAGGNACSEFSKTSMTKAMVIWVEWKNGCVTKNWVIGWENFAKSGDRGWVQKIMDDVGDEFQSGRTGTGDDVGLIVLVK